MRKQQGGYALLFSSSSSGSLFFIGQLSGVYVAFTQVPLQFQQQISQYIFYHPLKL